jgi:rRNA-processing protein FCF1
MTMIVGRVLLIVVGAVAGLALAPSSALPPATGALLGATTAVIAVGLEIAAGAAPLRPLMWIVAGGGAGMLAGLALGVTLAPLSGAAGPALRSLLGLIGAWVGGALASRRVGELATRAKPGQPDAGRILDTSVLVDGRVADVAAAGFLDGTTVVPQFVVRELQRLADSGDTLRRNRGRRGFDVLERLRQSPGVRLELTDIDYPDIAEVDAKLVALARARGARLLTSDTALARVAGLAGVTVGSPNDLALAVRPVALAGEGLHVQVTREGKEPGQGVAYLDDGTMVVVEGGKRFIGQPLDVVVTSVLQTSAGRMIFTRPRGEEAGGRDA